ncbi:hypothetical protein G5D20_001187 [Salmonella enterica]|nr:hypothetical protein [Salmonella enterica]EGF2332965.1 hypothetical protein [Salmonella enterica subsp. enterica serovar Ealing]EEQ1442464.1 hypothetical protein [Salmonella enterica]EFR0735917.1 hypothetical protein [Salmonella enterica]EFY7311460.1 hypothetical protein [Salmonella enterica]
MAEQTHRRIRVVFPAPAGINRRTIAQLLQDGGVPRASGDKPVYASGSTGTITCSPRQRG